MGNKLVIFLALFAINALIYSCGISNNFINLDDYIYVGHNVKVQSISLENIKWAFTTTYFGHYSPLLWLSYMLDYYIGNGEAIIFHIHNLIIHIINAYLVFLCTNLILKNRLKSFFVSLFFSILALNIEPVVWVSSRKDLLNGFYFFLTMLFYLIYKENKNKKEDNKIKTKKIKKAIDYFDEIIKSDKPDKAVMNEVLDKILIYHDKTIEFKLKVDINKLI